MAEAILDRASSGKGAQEVFEHDAEPDVVTDIRDEERSQEGSRCAVELLVDQGGAADLASIADAHMHPRDQLSRFPADLDERHPNRSPGAEPEQRDEIGRKPVRRAEIETVWCATHCHRRHDALS